MLSYLAAGGLAGCETLFLVAQRRIAPIALRLGAMPGSAESGGPVLAAVTVLVLATPVLLAFALGLFMWRLARPVLRPGDGNGDNHNHDHNDDDDGDGGDGGDLNDDETVEQ